MARREVDLGPVDAYAISVVEGYTGTREQWVQALADAEANGLKAEGYAVGEQNGTPVTSGEYFENNAKYYNEQAQSAKEDAETAQTAAETAQTAAETARTAAETAQTAAEAAAARDTAAWLNEHITNPDSPPLDRTLMSSSAAAPADMVGELKSAFDDVAERKVSTNLYNPATNLAGYFVNQGNGNIEQNSSYTATDFIPVETNFVISVSVVTTADALRYAIYNENKQWIAGDAYPTYNTDAVTGRKYLAFNNSEAKYIRFSNFNGPMQLDWMVENGTVPSEYVPYFNPYYAIKDSALSDNIRTQLTNAGQTTQIVESVGLEPDTVKGFNLSEVNTNGLGAYYNNYGTIAFIETNSYHYVIIPVKKNTLYKCNTPIRWWILADGNTVISSGTDDSSGIIDSMTATTLYITVSSAEWNNGNLIIAEGINGVVRNVEKPKFISGINQLMHDSWFAVALTSGVMRFTVGIAEKLYYHNILALDSNTIEIDTEQRTIEDNGVYVNPTRAVSRSNAYKYTAFDSNLSIVAELPKGYMNRVSIYSDNVQNCSALLFGDSIIAYGKIGQGMLNGFSARGKTITLLGTLGTGENKNEGRPGWTSDDYFTNKQYQGVTNPFYNPSTETFDFSYYMQNAGYTDVDYVVLHIGANDLYNTAMSNARDRIEQTLNNVCDMIDSILAFNPSQKIIVQLFSPVSANSTYVDKVAQKLIRAKFVNYNALALSVLAKYQSVRCSNDYMILDPSTDIDDNIHPNDGGMEKIAQELISQINCWQADIT